MQKARIFNICLSCKRAQSLNERSGARSVPVKLGGGGGGAKNMSNVFALRPPECPRFS